MTSFEDEVKNAKQTEDALFWLGVDAKAAPDVRERYQWATFTIRAFRSAEPRDLADAPSAQRRTRVVATGDLSLHGVAAPCEAELEATVAFDGSRGRAMYLRSVSDVRVDLAPHDVRPGDERGQFLTRAKRLLLDDVAGAADVALDVALEPVAHETSGHAP